MKSEAKYRQLLHQAEILSEKYRVAERDTFNVFTTLRSSHDEVNLHSRFLSALLNHRKYGEENRKNLKDFVEKIAKIKDFDITNSLVHREKDNIDIRIKNETQAIAIENKIHAEDQPEQLRRYKELLVKVGISDPKILYLTLDGYEASENSACGIEYETVSYKDDILPWLIRCQKRAYEEPSLRESISQYITLVKKLTGTDISDNHMDELKDLILEDKNITLVPDLNQALLKVKVDKLNALWSEIKEGIEEEIKKKN